MSQLEAYKSKLFRTDAQGRRVFAPDAPRGEVFLVENDADADRVARALLRTQWAVMVGCLLSWIAAAFNPLLLLGVPLSIAAGYLYRRRFLATLPRADVSADQLPAVDPVQRRHAQRVALGRRGHWDYLVAGALIVLIGIGGLVAASADHWRTVTTALGAVMVVAGAWSVLESARSLRALRDQTPGVPAS